MTLRQKTPLIVGLIFGCLIAALYAISYLIYRQGLVSDVYFFWSLWVFGLLCAAITMLYLEKTVLARLNRLHTSVQQVSASPDPAARVSISGRDELSSVADAINDMLEALQRSQGELRQSEERLRMVVQNMPAMMVAFDEQGNIIAWNQECERVTGYTAAQVVDNPGAIELLWPDTNQRQHMTREWFAHGYNYRDWEWQIVCRDGSARTVAWSNISQEFPIPGWEAWGIGIDVTERVQAQKELGQRLMEQETLFDMGRLISSSLQVDEVMRSVAEYMARLVDAVCCTLSDWDAPAGTLTVKARYVRPVQASGSPVLDEVGQSYPASERAVAAEAIRSRRPFVAYADGPGSDPREQDVLRAQHWSAVVGIPIVVLERVIGLAEVYLAHDAAPLTEYELRLLQSLVDQVGVAIDNARLFSVIQANEAAMRSLSLRLINAQEQERRRLAQELHDELGQLLTAIKINIDLARRRLPDARSPRARGEAALERRMQEASDLTDKVLTHVRAMTVDLRPTVLDDMGIVPALSWYLKRFAQRTGVQVQLDAPQLPGRLRSEIESTLYRVTQEALTNVARHARATHVRVQLALVGDMVTFTIEDDGIGFDTDEWARQEEQSTLGLKGIRERVMLLDGQAVVDARPGAGTRVAIRLPAHLETQAEEEPC